MGFRLWALLLLSTALQAQTVSLKGTVTDETGAIVPGTVVTLKGSSGPAKTATAAGDGGYSFVGLLPGDYVLNARTPQLILPEPMKITLKAGNQTANLQLKVAPTKQELSVQESALTAISTDTAGNASAVVLKGADLDALSDDPEDLLADLQALAGPAAGPSGGAIYIDGFAGGQLPPKESIREIRINQNPFTPEYDKLGLGRIEIFTKPGTDKFRGTFTYNFADDFWNTRNPYAAQKAPFLLNELGGNLGGPLGKRGSFLFDWQREMVDNGSVINGAFLDPDTLVVTNPFTDVSVATQRRATLGPRIDYQIDSNNTLMFRYRFNRDTIDDAGIGGVNLASRGYHNAIDNQTVQATETAVLGMTAVNETRFQFFRQSVENIPNSSAAALQVLGAFNAGGAQTGHGTDIQNSYELQNYTSITHRKHFWRFGVRLRAQTDDNVSPRNFGGTFTFAGGLAPKLAANNQPMLDSSGNPILESIESIDRYRRTLLLQRLGFSPAAIRQLGGGATQFSINAGNPALSAHQFDLAAFVSDDWRVLPNFTLNLGLRYETQTNLHDWRDFAPRIAMAWAPPGHGALRPKTVVRAGFGVFYDRFPLANTITARRYNGALQQPFAVPDTSILDSFPNVPPASALAPFQSQQTIQQISGSLRAPYILQSAVSIERQLPADTSVALTYTNSHGLHMLRSEDINAPLPGTYNPNIAGSGVYPHGTPGPILLMESSGLYNQNQLIVNVNTRATRNISLFGSYMKNHANSNTDGLGTYPANPYSSAGEYGPASTDIRNRVTFGGSINTKWNTRLSPLFTWDSGAPFDITSGSDPYGTTLFNERPGIATDPYQAGVIHTAYGLLDPNPTLGETILPRNFGRGPSQVRFNLRLSKTIGFGASREGPRNSGPSGTSVDRGRSGNVFGGGATPGRDAGPTNRRYNFTVSMSILNLLNHNNPGPINGNVTSPLFGRANQPAGAGGPGFSESANNRRLELQTRFTF